MPDKTTKTEVGKEIEEKAEHIAREFCRNTPRIKKESGVEFYERLNATIFNLLTTHHQELHKAREREAYLWFENWYSHYKAPLTAESNQDFGKWATERLQTVGVHDRETKV